jgi:hypothetical protein
VHRTTSAAVLGAAALVALGLSGCDGNVDAGPAPVAKPSVAALAPPSEATAPLPPPEALTDVMARLTDPNVPGSDKVGLIENSTPADAAALDTFTKALHDSGLMPLSFEAHEVTWAQSHPGDVAANIVVKASSQQNDRDFSFPMEFSPNGGSWQLTRQTADMLLKLGQAQTATPTG